jgi:predicted N-acetyltransferase YhbS
MPRFVPIADADPAAVERLLDRAFGTDRHGRTAYAIRAGADPLPALSFAAFERAELVGAIQCWPVALTLDDGGVTAMTMVGPVAVDPARQRDGIGHALMEHMLAVAARSGDDRALMLIGDPEYYGRFFGFTADRTALWRAPGPVERRRLLARGPAAPGGAGMLGARATIGA